MRWPRWRIATGRGDFVPLMIGCVLLFISVPAFVLLLIDADQNSGLLGFPLTALMGAGMMIGVAFLVLGVQLMSMPGSWPYRIAHGRIFWR